MNIEDIHIGDRLVLRSDLIDGECYGADGIVDEDEYVGEWSRATPNVMEYSGQVLTVSKFAFDFYIEVEEDASRHRIWFAPSMFECREGELGSMMSVIEESDLIDLLGC